MKHGSLFSGIGGFDLAAEWMEWENVFHCEWNEFGQQVLKYHFPKSISYADITKTDFTIHRGKIDIITGGFPCQPYSTSGERKGNEDERHLWPEMLRAIREIQPSYVVGENVRGLVNWGGGLVFDEVQANLENEGFEILPFLLPACSKNAPHERERIWFIAYANGRGLPRNGERYVDCLQQYKKRETSNQFDKYPLSKWKLEKRSPGDIRRLYGLSEGLDNLTISAGRAVKEGLKAFGNAIVPQVAYEIFTAIEKYNNLNQ